MITVGNLTRSPRRLRLVLVGAATVLAVLAVGAIAPPKASADACTALYPPGGRTCRYGYFQNTYEAIGHNVYPAPMNVTNMDQFLAAVGYGMSCVNGVPTANVQTSSGAAFIVLTMLGYPAGTPENVACQQYARWDKLVRDYTAAGLVNYNFINYQYVGNTYYQDQIDDGWVDSNSQYWSGISADTVVFFSPIDGQPVYAIRKECANPVGSMAQLPPVQQPPSGSVSAATVTCTQISGTAVDPNTPNTAVKIMASFSNGEPPAYTDTNPGNQSFSMPTPASVQNSINPVTIRVYAFDTTSGQPAELNGSPVTVTQCLKPTPQCAGFTIATGSSTLDSPDPSLAFTLTARVSFASEAQAVAILQQTNDQFYLHADGPNIGGGGSNLYNNPSETPIRHDAGSTTLYVTHVFGPTNATGAYTISWGLTGTAGGISCGGNASNGTGTGPPGTFNVLGHPYFNVSGGDVSAGAPISGTPGAGTACAGNGDTPQDVNASIIGWNLHAQGAYAGAGTDFGAFAMNYLQDFATGKGSTNADTGRALDPDGLSFANTAADGRISLPRGLYGGNFGNFTSCVPNVFNEAKAVKAGPAGYDINAGATGLGVGTVGNATGLLVPNGMHKTIYVDGDAVINSNIIYAGNGSYANMFAVPSFTLVVRGDVFISPNVSQIDGVIIAQPTKGKPQDKGRVYTCAPTGVSDTLLTADLATTCNTKLTFNGAVIARQVWLLRSFGSVASSPAEQFNYSPEDWLGNPFGDGGTGAGNKYDSITSLPPVL